jgi:hypothetical protein
MTVKIPTYIPYPAQYFGGNDYMEMERPVLPSSWTNDISGFYYVDSEHPSATDSNTNGWPTEPRLTLPDTSEAAPLAAGSVIIVANTMQGSGNGQRYLHIAGSEASPIWLSGVSIDEPCSFVDTVFIKGSYAIIENIWVEQGFLMPTTRVHGDSECSHVCYRHCRGVGDGELQIGNSSIISIYTDYAETSPLWRSHIIVYDCIFSDFGDAQNTRDNGGDAGGTDYHAFITITGCSYVWFINNDAQRMGSDGLQIGKASTSDDKRCHHIYACGNYFASNGENAVDVKKCHHVVIAENECYDSANSLISHNFPTQVWFVNNFIYDSWNGIVDTGTYNAYFVGNSMWNIKRDGNFGDETSTAYPLGGTVFTVRGSTGVTFVNNTAYDYYRGVCVQAGDSHDIRNNILAGKSTANEYDIYAASGSATTTMILNNNIFHDTGGFKAKFNGEQTAISQVGTDNLSADPLLVTTGTPNQRNQTGSNSPAHDEGDSIASVLADYLTAFGEDLENDIYGFTRTQGTSVDIGAYESGGSLHTVAPNRPSQLHVDVVSAALVWRVNSQNETGFRVYEDNTLVSTLSVGATSYSLATISDAVKAYKVEAFNAQGSSVTTTISSSLVSVSNIALGTSVTIPVTQSALGYRTGRIENSGDLVISKPETTGTLYGLDSQDLTITYGAQAFTSGSVYIRADNLNNGFQGTLVGTGQTSLYTLDAVTSGESLSGSFKISDSVVKLDNSGFSKNVTKITVTGTNVSYSLKPNNLSQDLALGIIAIEED